MDTPQPKRLYQVWKGNNRFFCGGRLIFGPDVASLFLSTLLIAGPSITFCFQVIVKMNTHRKTDSTRESDQSHILCPPILIVAALVLMLNLISLFLTSSRDPGIVPRNTRPPEFDEAFEGPPSMEWVNGRTPYLKLPRTKEVIVDGFVVKVKFCDTCLMYRLPRASHCSICNNCVQKFDHHCPWVGQCIGLRNYRFFYLFISSSTFLCIYVFTFSWLNIIEERKHLGSIWKSMAQEITSVVLIIYTFVAVWFVGGLTCFHTYLICTNQTTYENFRYRYDKKENPYSKGVMKNFKDVFFSKIPHSLNDFRSWVLEEPIEAESFIRMDIVRPMDKICVEMSNKPALDGSMPLPEILQNLDYGGLDDDLKRDKHGGDAVDLFAFPVLQEPVIQESMEPHQETISQGTAGA